jgi:pimeloyl-ACP methyl ester carboxylesterase
MNIAPLLLASLAVTSGDSVHVPVAPSESLRVVIAGSGAPVVLIPSPFGAAFGYRHVVEGLTGRGMQAIVIEPLGSGGSSRPKDADYSLTAQAQRIAAVLDTLHVDSAIVVAHSLGASIAWRLAYSRPDLVRGLISIEGGVAESATSDGFRRLMRFAPLLKIVGRGAVRPRFIREMKAASADTAWIDEAVLEGYTAGAMADFGATLDAYRAMSRSHEPEVLADRLQDVSAPVLLLLGAAQHSGAPDTTEIALLERRLPNVITERIPDAGHYIQEERPDAVLAAIVQLANGAAERVVSARSSTPTP